MHRAFNYNMEESHLEKYEYKFIVDKHKQDLLLLFHQQRQVVNNNIYMYDLIKVVV